MSIHGIYQAKDFGEAIDIAQHNCATCTECKCKNMSCPSQKALMDVSEKHKLNDYEKKAYFRQIGG